MIFLRDEIDISRVSTSGTWVQGFFIPSGSPVELEARGNIQPFDGEEVRQLPEFDQFVDFVRIFSQTELKLNDIVNGVYEVVKLKGYQRSLRLPHYEAIGVTTAK